MIGRIIVLAWLWAIFGFAYYMWKDNFQMVTVCIGIILLPFFIAAIDWIITGNTTTSSRILYGKDN